MHTHPLSCSTWTTTYSTRPYYGQLYTPLILYSVFSLRLSIAPRLFICPFPPLCIISSGFCIRLSESHFLGSKDATQLYPNRPTTLLKPLQNHTPRQPRPADRLCVLEHARGERRLQRVRALGRVRPNVPCRSGSVMHEDMQNGTRGVRKPHPPMKYRNREEKTHASITALRSATVCVWLRRARRLWGLVSVSRSVEIRRDE